MSVTKILADDIKWFISEFRELETLVNQPFSEPIRIFVITINNFMTSFAGLIQNADTHVFFETLSQYKTNLHTLMRAVPTGQLSSVLPIINALYLVLNGIPSDIFQTRYRNARGLFIIHKLNEIGIRLMQVKDNFQYLGPTAAAKLKEIAERLRSIELARIEREPKRLKTAGELDCDLWLAMGRLADLMEHI